MVIDNQVHMSAPDRIGRVRLSSNPKSKASATAPPIPITIEVMVRPNQLPSRIFHEPYDPFAQNDMQMRKPVMVAARNPARDLRGANRIAGMNGKWAGRGGVYLPHNRPMVDAVVSDQDRLYVSLLRRLGDRRSLRENGDDSDVSRI